MNGINYAALEYPVTPHFTDVEARVGWERSLPNLVITYYQTYGRVFGNAYRGVGSVGWDAGDVGDSLPVGSGVCSQRVVGAVEQLGGVLCDACSGSGGACVHRVEHAGADDCGVAESSGGGGDGGGVGRVGVDAGDTNVSSAVCAGDDGAGEPTVLKRRKMGSRQRRRLRLAKEQEVGDVPVESSVPPWRVRAKPQGFCETVASQTSCPSYGTALSEAEREAKESLARRRAAENAVAEKLAKMKLASLEDEKRCQEYADLKRSRIVQWTNEAIAKSQESLDKSKSIDPGSSNSQYEIRQQARKVIDLEEQVRHLTQVATLEGTVEERIAAMQQLENHETTSEYIKAQADCWGEMRPGSVDPGSDDFKVTVPYRPGRFRVLRNSELDSDLRL